MSFWDKVKNVANKGMDAGKLAAHKTRLRTEMIMIDRDIKSRKQTFGIMMYDHLSPLSQSADFYAANDELTNMLRPHLIETQREIQALAAKRVKLKEQQAQAEVTRASAFPTKAETVVDKMKNAGKSTYLAGGETKIKAEIVIVDTQIKNYKQKFGVALYDTMVDAEDNRNYLPSDRTVRTYYDQCRQDITNMLRNKDMKQKELDTLCQNDPNNNNNAAAGTGDMQNALNDNGGQQMQQSQQQQQQQQNQSQFHDDQHDDFLI